MSAFVRYAEIYDDMMRIVNYDGIINSLMKVLNHYDIITNSVLDLGCGTGNLTLRFAEKGFAPIFGIDNSYQMLIKAKAKFAESPFQVTFIQEDIRSYEITTQVDLVVGLLGCINYLLDVESLSDMFKSVRRSLKLGGVFIFDYFTEEQILNDYQGTHFRDESCGSQIYQSKYDIRTKIEEAKVTVFVPTQKGVYDRFDEIHITRTHRLEEIILALNRSGLTLMGHWVPGLIYNSEENPRPYIVCRNI